MTSFPLQANVLLQGLVKMPDLNDKKGVVKGPLENGRHQVYVEDMSKTFALKPTNLKYEGRSASSLSIKELKAVLETQNGSDSGLTGIDKSELQSKVTDLGFSEEKIAEVLAVANAPSPRSAARAAATPAVDPTQAANQLANMSPDQLRQQAMAMKSMDPNTLRRANPQFANLSDFQIRQAADQMLMMANNPEMLKQASSQIKNMSPEEVQRMQNQVANNGVPPAEGQKKVKKSSAKANNGQPMHAQYQEASNKMANMTPEELKQQASMMRSMDPDTIRKLNPQLAHMNDNQIREAASQFEMMASNPEMFKMAMDQMKNLSPEEMENLQKGMPAGGGTGTDASGNGGANAEMSAEMLKNMDKKQLKSMLNMVKDNPDMLKQFSGMSGMSEDKLKGFIDQFSQMDDDKLDSAVSMMQKAAAAKDLWSKADKKTGGNLLKIVIASALLFTFLFFKWLFGGSSAVSESKILNEALNTMEGEAVPPDSEPESEF
ncbi:unnamed protein product [Cylindrotheca closterium]|uniref:Uncharacterized protein n=1 Tax=Cylindrotheca closterium TaxID=2856 RepID=A0AAD2G362_9STRA|nr:unnamed protein product [Cylindrotheca closterium]